MKHTDETKPVIESASVTENTALEQAQHSDISAFSHFEYINDDGADGQVQHSEWSTSATFPHSECADVESEHRDESVTADTPKAGLKPKRGRPADPAKADRVQVSVYLPRATYEGIKDLAAHHEMGISDLLCKIAFFFTENNADTLARFREVKQMQLKF